MTKLQHGNATKRALAIFAAAITLIFGTSQAFAASNSVTEKSRAAGMADAPALITEAKLPCDLSDAHYIGEASVKVDGKSVKGKSYEIACKGSAGWIITKTSAGVETPYNCTQGATYAIKNKDVPQCILPANLPHYAWLQAYASTYAPDCVTNKAHLIGSIKGDAPIDRYEVGCSNGSAIIIDLPTLGSKATISYRNCLMTEGTSSACEYQNHEQAVNQIKPLGQKADAKCAISNARFVGITSDLSGYYYEIGCSNQPGYVILVKNDNSLDHSVTCVAAKPLGGCQFTTLADAAATETTYYTKVMKDAGIDCTVQEFNIIGTQPTTKRDYVEFKCPEKPFGLIGFVPQEGSQSTANMSDCFIDKTRKNVCGFVSEDILKAQIDKLIKIALPSRGCDVSDVRYIGEADSEAEAVILEVACVNKRGYIGMLSADRTKISNTIPCKIAKAHNDEIQCEIAGNGTYGEGE